MNARARWAHTAMLLVPTILIAACAPDSGPSATMPAARTPCETAYAAMASAGEEVSEQLDLAVFETCSALEYMAANETLQPSELLVLDRAWYKKRCQADPPVRLGTRLCTTLAEELDLP